MTSQQFLHRNLDWEISLALAREYFTMDSSSKHLTQMMCVSHMRQKNKARKWLGKIEWSGNFPWKMEERRRRIGPVQEHQVLSQKKLESSHNSANTTLCVLGNSLYTSQQLSPIWKSEWGSLANFGNYVAEMSMADIKNQSSRFFPTEIWRVSMFFSAHTPDSLNH